MSDKVNPLERKIQAEVNKYAKSKGMLVYKFASPSNRGVADCIWAYCGKVIFVEYKRADGKLSALQQKFIDDMHAQRIPAIVVFDINFGKACVDELVQALNPTEEHTNKSGIIIPAKMNLPEQADKVANYSK